MDLLTNNFATNSGFYFADPTNIADVYSGYKEMFDAREPDLEEKENDDEDLKQYKSQLRSQIASNRQALDGYIQEYDKVNGVKKHCKISYLCNMCPVVLICFIYINDGC